MEQLPLELIEKILSPPVLTVQDVVNFSSTCGYFREAVLNSSIIWKQKFINKWPKLVHMIDRNGNFYLKELQYSYEVKRRMMAQLMTMSARFYRKYQLSDTDLEEWRILMCEKRQTYHYLCSFLTEIVNTNETIRSIEEVPINTPGNKTLQYYAYKVLRYIKQLHLTEVWTDYVSLPPEKQILERGAAFVAQWCQPEIDITGDDIASTLDIVAHLVKRRLHETYPSHKIFQASEEDLAQWRNENLTRSQWTVPECQQLILTMREVMYKELGFGGSTEGYYMSQNSLINKVLETRKGLPIILAIIYESVGRRLGLLFEPINFPAHFLLRFCENDGPRTKKYYIDTFNGGNVMQKTACPYRTRTEGDVFFPVATAAKVVERIANNLELSTRQHVEHNGRVTHLRSILELLKLVSPQDLSALVSLAKLYMLHRINTKSLEDYLATQTFSAPEQARNILHMIQGFSKHHVDSPFDVPATQRSPDLKFAVGMIMKDVSHNGDKCVIYSWNVGCSGVSASTECLEAPHSVAFHSKSKPKQPFYNVLMEDGSYRYVAQETLVPTTEVGALHSNKDLGRHFSHFFNNHFVPNAEKEREFPADKRVRHKFYYETQLAHYRP